MFMMVPCAGIERRQPQSREVLSSPQLFIRVEPLSAEGLKIGVQVVFDLQFLFFQRLNLIMAYMNNLCFHVLNLLIEFVVLFKQLSEMMILILEFGNEVTVFGKHVLSPFELGIFLSYVDATFSSLMWINKQSWIQRIGLMF